MTQRVLVFVVSLLATANATSAQPKERIGLWAADVRVASTGLPSEPGWTPALPSGSITPTRTAGLEVGAHVHLVRLRAIALGIGATWLRARGTTTAPDAPTPATTITLPEVTTTLTSWSPLVSLNFGHALGWSYLSAGLGRSRVESAAVLTGRTFTPVDSDWVKTLNYGGGARWFLNDRLGVGFDIRWHKLSLVAATTTRPAAPRASLLVAGAGIVLK